MRRSILIVDDDTHLTNEIATQLASKFEIQVEADFTTSLEHAQNQRPDLVLLDYRLENQDGVRWLEAFRHRGQRTPVIVMSGYPDQKMAIDFMKRGVSGFLEKPFLIEELLEAIQSAVAEPDQSFHFDRERHCVSLNGTKVNLTPTEYKILEILVDNAGKTVQRQHLIQAAMGRDAVSRNAIDTHICNLKRKIPPLESKIKVVYGRGFLFD